MLSHVGQAKPTSDAMDVAGRGEMLLFEKYRI